MSGQNVKDFKWP